MCIRGESPVSLRAVEIVFHLKLNLFLLLFRSFFARWTTQVLLLYNRLLCERNKRETMLAVQQKVSIQATGNKTTVASNDIAKLMYYLNCINACLGRPFDSTLTNHANYYNLTREEELAVIIACGVVSPDELVGKV
jgi:hypothetical protein